jgi:hypothetical protein
LEGIVGRLLTAPDLAQEDRLGEHLGGGSQPLGIDPGELAAYPSLSEASKIIGVAASTLSRRGDIRFITRGNQLRVPPHEVIRLNRYYRRRTDYEVGGALQQLADARSPAHADSVEERIQAAFEGIPAALLSVDDFLKEARKGLPKKLYLEIERIYQERTQASIVEPRHTKSDRSSPVDRKRATGPSR